MISNEIPFHSSEIINHRKEFFSLSSLLHHTMQFYGWIIFFHFNAIVNYSYLNYTSILSFISVSMKIKLKIFLIFVVFFTFARSRFFMYSQVYCLINLCFTEIKCKFIKFLYSFEWAWVKKNNIQFHYYRFRRLKISFRLIYFFSIFFVNNKKKTHNYVEIIAI
jgi:hypothetical protein